MAPLSKDRRKGFKASGNSHGSSRSLKRKREEEDISTLQQRIQDLNPKKDEPTSFSDLPLSQLTTSGLEASHFKTLTDIQKRALPLALKGSDILGAAKTGSGKTLAFLVPVLENLVRKRWTELDGLGALILSPTRELAIQIFEVLRKIGRYHTFSAGLVIGGKSLQEERERMGRMNILVCTPGRMLQHMDQTAAFEIDNLQMLVLDEADRIMDMGFQSTVDAIVEHLPQQRQTLLFSATQTKKVSDLARLSLKDPEYVSVHEAASSATPANLQQNYIVTPLQEKLDTLWSFIRANLKSKVLVFLSSGKQVRFVYESFRHMQPGIPILHLHGRQKQTARLDITSKFSATRNACLLATDVVARGLDFPAVDWVIQLDCPEDADTYIHRVGRTARYESNGRAVLFLEPSEEAGMLKRLEQRKVPIERINVRQKKQQSIQSQLQNMCFKDPELKYLGQKAFISYVKSINLQKDKEIFKLSELPLEEFSTSMGLPGAPKIKFLKGDSSKSLKNAPRYAGHSSQDEVSDKDSVEGTASYSKAPIRTKYDRMFERRNQDVLAGHYTQLAHNDGQGEDGVEGGRDSFLTVKRRFNSNAEVDSDLSDNQHSDMQGDQKLVASIGKEPLVIDSKRKEKLLKSKKKSLKLKEKGTKLVFGEDGNPHQMYELENEDQFRLRGPAEEQKTEFLRVERDRLSAADLADKAAAKAKRKEKREKRKARERENAEGDVGDIEDDETGVVLEPFEEGDVQDASDASSAAHGREDDLDDLDEEMEIEDGLRSEPIKKRRKQWFEDDSGEEKQPKSRAAEQASVHDRDRLEDLEALASGFLGA